MVNLMSDNAFVLANISIMNCVFLVWQKRISSNHIIRFYPLYKVGCVYFTMIASHILSGGSSYTVWQ